jgi:hypothetical protein
MLYINAATNIYECIYMIHVYTIKQFICLKKQQQIHFNSLGLECDVFVLFIKYRYVVMIMMMFTRTYSLLGDVAYIYHKLNLLNIKHT